MDDPNGLERFIEAQRPVFQDVVAELGAGRKRSHWMWFVFPQIAGLGQSPMAVRYAIRSLDEANAFLAHEVLGRRLRITTELVLRLQNKPVSGIFGHHDDMKFRSSMTLFAQASLGDVFFDGQADPVTIAHLAD